MSQDIIVLQKINFLRAMGKNSHQISAALIKDHKVTPKQLRELNLPSMWTVSSELSLMGSSPKDLVKYSLPTILALKNKEDSTNYVVKDSYLFTYKDGILTPTTKWCRDQDWALGSAHDGEICFREIGRKKNSSSAGQICFYKDGGGYDSRDVTGWARGFAKGGYRCDYSYYDGVKHVVTDYLPYATTKIKRRVKRSLLEQVTNFFKLTRPTLILPCFL